MNADWIRYPIYVAHEIVNSETTIEQICPKKVTIGSMELCVILTQQSENIHYWDMTFKE